MHLNEYSHFCFGLQDGVEDLASSERDSKSGKVAIGFYKYS